VAKPYVPVPVRALFPDERIQMASAMGGVVIIRSTPPPPSVSNGGSGSFTDADRAMLQAIYNALKPMMGGK